MTHKILAISNIGKGLLKKIVIDKRVKGFPQNMQMNFEGSVASWLTDRSGLYFTINKIRKNDDQIFQQQKYLKGSPEDKAGSKADVAIWHWKKRNLPSQQSSTSSFNYSSRHSVIYSIKNNRVVSLSSESDTHHMSFPQLSDISSRHKYVIAIDDGNSLQSVISGKSASVPAKDIYLVDLNTGKKRKVLTEIGNIDGKLSPDGNYFVYFNDRHFYLYDIRNNKSINLTQNVSASFVSNSDRNPEKLNLNKIYPIWTKDGELLLEGNWDIWYVPIKQGKPGKLVNLTVNGSKNKIKYSMVPVLTLGRFEVSKVTSSKQAIYVHALEKRTKKSGYAKIFVNKPGVQWLKNLENVAYSGNFRSSLVVSKDGESYFYSKSTYKEKAYYISDKDFKKSRKLLVDNLKSIPERENYLWSAGAQVVNYTCKSGDEAEGALFLPANYKKGKSYPTVTLIYENHMSTNLHLFPMPDMGSYDWTSLTSRGYAVFMTDIHFQPGNPGVSGFGCLMPGLDAAVKTGIVDPNKLGLHGHSWGGYQSVFYMTQTDRFKAVIASAPITNLISMHGSVYWNEMQPNHTRIERGQGRMINNLWDAWPAYQNNSPIYHAPKIKTPLLLIHNDKDGAVDFTQGVAFFNSLRRLKKEVVMLQYRGENHDIYGRENKIDYSRRRLEFWDYHLKDKPAPTWWSNGIK